METKETIIRPNINMIPTWGIDELAEYLGKSPETIKTYISRKPHIIPPCAKGFKRRWVQEVVYAFYTEGSSEQRKSLKRRPRKN